ncbi:site-specific integrase [Sphingobium sp. HBC34]|uniref:Site-specific integrase n=1 Tax=Sphingobium cyanobacteriorum TaxID=3063954 RepID=A0ABT8ZTL9_9SPHN|nr:site-specific integrase [Sphingobium sp. HBC34]MDO7837085.1 site-specific integrase [Sphingobium sp. HBC34]
MRENEAGWHIYDADGRRKYLNKDERTRFTTGAYALAPADRAFCLVLAYTGCRISEALALARFQIDVDRSAITFRTLKRRKVVFRTVPVPGHLCELLLSLPPQNQDRFWAMHRVTAWRCVRAMLDGLSIVGPMACPRGLRHGFGIHAATCNVPPNLIQRWMGHASPATTGIYIDAVGPEESEFASRMWQEP